MERGIRLRALFAKNPVGEDILVQGWVKSVRTSKSVNFMVINDGSIQSDLQIIIDPGVDGADQLQGLLTGSAVGVRGTVKESPGKGQSIEVHANHLQVYGGAAQDYPLQKKRHSIEFLREVAHVRSRTNALGAVFRVRHTLALATHRFFHKKGYFYLNAPIVTANDAEGAGETFRVTTLDMKNLPKNDKGEIDYSKDYFGKATYLSVTGQLEAEAHALGLGAVYTFGPTFRSENSNTSRHLSEFWMIEPEVAFADLEDVAELADAYIKFMIKAALEENPEEMAFFDQRIEPGLIDRLKHVLSTPLQKVSYTEAIEILEKSGQKFEYAPKWGMDMQSEHERYLAEKHFNGPVAVMDYPKDIKAFYMKQNPDGKTVRALDVLVPGVGELIGGSQREDDHGLLLKRMREMDIPEKGLEWYLDLRRFGGAPHAGFGLGFERAIMYITGMSNIRDVIAFPRYPGHCEF